MNELIRTLVEEFHTKVSTFTDGVPREITFPKVPNKVIVAIGMRRVGKTYLLWQVITQLLQTIPITQLLYINFEDNRLMPISQKKFSDVLDGFYSLYPENYDRICYFFLDEIQNVTDWQTVIRRYLDNKKVKIYLTGSSANLLSKEIATSLRGRSMATEVWPFSFKEFLEARQISFPQKPLGKKSLDHLIRWLKEYLHGGGFPEVTTLIEGASMPEDDRRRILQDYTSVVIFRDIIERYKITNISLVRYLIKTLLKNVGNHFSAHKFYNDLKSQSFPVSKMTIHDYLSYIEDAYFAFTVPLFSESLRKVQTNPKKIYAVDTGLITANVLGFSENIGHYFENLIYLDLRRAQHSIYYYLTHSNRLEVDFLTQDPFGKMHLFQVCWNVDDEKTFARENTALKIAMEELKIEGEVITPQSYFYSFLPKLRAVT